MSVRFLRELAETGTAALQGALGGGTLPPMMVQTSSTE